MNAYKHAASVATAVHDGLVAWARTLAEQAGLEEMEIWGRFPPEGTTRSYMVLLPYRVGPGPLLHDNAPGTSLFMPASAPADQRRSVPAPWCALADALRLGMDAVFPEASAYRPGDRIVTSPYSPVADLPKALRAWYEEHADDPAGWVVHLSTGLRAVPPSLAWRSGNRVTVHYMAFAADPGRGASSRTSDTAPLALPALAVLTTALQLADLVDVQLPARPLPEGLEGFVAAFAEACEERGADADVVQTMRSALEALTEPFVFQFSVAPMNDLNDQEFALLTQALQRPLQAVLNFRVRFPVALHAEFAPAPLLAPRTTQAAR